MKETYMEALSVEEQKNISGGSLTASLLDTIIEAFKGVFAPKV